MGEKPQWQILKDNKEQGAATMDTSQPAETLKPAEIKDGGNESVKRSTPKDEQRSRDGARPAAESGSVKVAQETESVQRVKFPAMQETGLSDHAREKIDYLRDVDLDVSVELGNTVLSINHILGVEVGSVIELNQTVGEEVKILINGNAYALGEVVVIGEKFGVRILKIIHE